VSVFIENNGTKKKITQGITGKGNVQRRVILRQQ